VDVWGKIQIRPQFDGPTWGKKRQGEISKESRLISHDQQCRILEKNAPEGISRTRRRHHSGIYPLVF
jgi:hypothetical protein